MLTKVFDRINTPYSAKGLGVFRIVFGVVLFFQTVYFKSTGLIEQNILIREIEYPFFDFIKPLSSSGMNGIILIMFLSSIGIAVGRFFKISCLLFFASFTYVWLLEKGIYNNHYYFISLICFLLIWTSADKVYALGRKSIKTVPAYHYWIIQSQLFIIFFIAGVNKINGAWLIDFEPMKSMLDLKVQAGGPAFLGSVAFAGILSWAGMLFDVFIIVFLFLKRSRKIAVGLYLVFNLFNFYLFIDTGEIGFFPFLLIGFLPLFWYFTKSTIKEKDTEKKQPISKPVIYMLSVYFLLQVIIPFRHLFLENDVDWAGKGQRFSWRMKIMVKEVDYMFYVKLENGDKKSIRVQNLLTKNQFSTLYYYPDLIPNLADYLKESMTKQGMENIEITADFKVALNGGKQQILIDPEADLSSVEYHSFSNDAWLLPLKK